VIVIPADRIAADLGLEPHPEGGYFRETYRAAENVATPRGLRSLATAIFFLVTADGPSRFHRLASDELWLHDGGARLELLTLMPDGGAERVVLAGAGRLSSGEEVTPQAIVPAGAWQAARVLPSEGGVDWTLVTCVVTPGFDYADFELADAAELVVAYPEQAEVIGALT
jgi:predicted cupin superfamily sugar epimerase